MTIALVVNVPEGIILASDSQATLHVTVPISTGNKVSINYSHPSNKFEKTQKIFNLSTDDLRMGVLQFGTANPGGRPLSSHVYSLREIMASEEISTISDGKDMIVNHFSNFDPSSIKGLGFYFAGYDTTDSEYRFVGYHLSWMQGSNCKVDDLSETLSNYGANWSGSGGWIVTKLMNLEDKKLKIAPAIIPWQYLSLANGVDLCDFLIQTVIGFEKFQSRFPTCGGQPQISVITPTQYVTVKKSSDFAV
jgi:hypothetical protein